MQVFGFFNNRKGATSLSGGGKGGGEKMISIKRINKIRFWEEIHSY